MVQPANARFSNSVVVHELVNRTNIRGGWEKDLSINKKKAANEISEFLLIDLLNKVADLISPFHELPSSSDPYHLNCSFDLKKNCVQIRTWAHNAADLPPFKEFFAHFEEQQPVQIENVGESSEISGYASIASSSQTSGPQPDMKYFQNQLAKVCQLVQNTLNHTLSALHECAGTEIMHHQVEWYRRADHYLALRGPSGRPDNQLTISVHYEKRRSHSNAIDRGEFDTLPDNIKHLANAAANKLNDRAEIRKRWEKDLHNNKETIAQIVCEPMYQKVLEKLLAYIPPFYALPTSSRPITVKISLDLEKSIVAIKPWTTEAAGISPLNEWLPVFEKQDQASSADSVSTNRIEFEYFHGQLAKIWHIVEENLKDNFSALNQEIQSASSEHPIATIQHNVVFYRAAEKLIGSSSSNDNQLTASLWFQEPQIINSAPSEAESSDDSSRNKNQRWCGVM